MLEVSVPHQHSNIMMPMQMKTYVVVQIFVVGINAPFHHHQKIALKMFQIVNGFIHKILATSKHTLTNVCIHTAEFQSDVLAVLTTFQIEF